MNDNNKINNGTRTLSGLVSFFITGLTFTRQDKIEPHGLGSLDSPSPENPCVSSTRGRLRVL